jgi:hypothetical protein
MGRRGKRELARNEETQEREALGKGNAIDAFLFWRLILKFLLGNVCWICKRKTRGRCFQMYKQDIHTPQGAYVMHLKVRYTHTYRVFTQRLAKLCRKIL